MKSLRKTIGRALTGMALAAFSLAAAAQGYPTKPVKIVVPFGAGGVADITARVVAQKLSERLGQQFLVDNRPSAGGIVAADAVAKADPDGYTLLLVSNGTAVSVSLFKSLPYDPIKDFSMVSTIGFFDLVLVTDGKAPISSVKEAVAAAKKDPSKFNIGTINIGSTQHLAAEYFKSVAGLDVTTVPYKGSPAVLAALKASDVQIAFEILAPVMPHIKSGSLKALAVTSDRRFAGLPDVPTVIESGVANYNVASWNGIAAPANTPRPIVEQLSKEINAVLALPDVKQKFLELGVTARGGSPEELRRLLGDEIERWKGVVTRANIEKQ